MSDPVEELYTQEDEITALLRNSGEISLALSLSDLYRKSLLLAAASYFEARLVADVQAYCDSIVGESAPLSSLTRIKAISRQYHTWFDWDKSNANKFFSLFGDGFKKHMEALGKSDERISVQIASFLSLGSDRNRLVHQNFGSFSLEASADEIIQRYRSAIAFVTTFKQHLDNYTAANFPKKTEPE